MPKLTAVGLNVTAGAYTVPVPVKGTVCEPPGALSVSTKEAVRAPATGGVKVTLIVQEALTASEVGQLLVCAKSLAFVPVTEMPAIARLAVPVFVSVTVWAALVVLVIWLPKLRLEELNVTVGDGATIPL